MQRGEFLRYKRRFVDATRKVLEVGRSDALAEAAFPAYANPNPLISFLFWRRVHVVMKLLAKCAPFETVLDFGCGGGVMLPFLATLAKRVVAYDVDLGPLEAMRQHLPLPDNVEAVRATSRDTMPFAPGTFDVVAALDVLEHVPDLPGTVEQIWRTLKPGGRLVASGPTESAFYKLGRKIAGPEYSGHYHVTNVYDLRRVMAERGRVETVATLFYPLPLFKVYAAQAAS